MRKVLPLVIVFIFVVSILAILFVPTNAHADGNPHANDKACWGQASAVFAKMRSSNDPERSAMGEHASQQAEPRDGLGVLAVLLYDDGNGPLGEPTLQALGAYLVSLDPNLTIEACMEEPS